MNKIDDLDTGAKIEYYLEIEKIGKRLGVEGDYLFHGGCHGCESPERYGIQRCMGCQYFNADWDLPSLSTQVQVKCKYCGHSHYEQTPNNGEQE